MNFSRAAARARARVRLSVRGRRGRIAERIAPAPQPERGPVSHAEVRKIFFGLMLAAFLAALNQTTLELLGRRNVTELLQALVARASILLKSPHAEISLLEQGDLVLRAFSRGRDYRGGEIA